MDQHMKALVSIEIIEKDNNGDVLPVWSYPEVGEDLEEVLILRSGLKNDTVPIQYSFSKYKGEWCYISIHPSKSDARVVAFAICLVTTDFNPEKYQALCKFMAEIYSNDGDPLKLLECWLAVFARGKYRTNFDSSEFDPRASYLATALKDVVKLFGEEIILLWTALIMKKRIVVYCDKLGALLKFIRAIPLLVWHRQNWDILRPYMTLSENELKDIKSSSVYCAGFTNEEVKEREDLYDILVDVNNRSVSVASHAKQDFLMTSVHKDICNFLLNDEPNDAELIKGLTLKTKELLTKLETLKVEYEDGNSYIDLATLQNTRLPANMDRFLFNVASAEGMTKV